MTDNFNQVAESIRRLAIQYRDMEVAANALEQIGSLDNAIKEMNKQRAATSAELTKVQAALADANQQVLDAKSATKVIMDKAAQDAKQVVSDANDKGAGIVADAEKKASGAAAAAMTQVQAKLDEINAQIERRQAVLGDLDAVIASKTAEADAAEARAKDAADKLAKVQAQISKLASGG